MSVHTELCHFDTADGERLHGLWFTPEGSAGPERPAFILVHGVAMNFYSGPLPIMGQLLAERGYPALSMNTRGHDWVARAGDLTAFGGAAFEVLEGCLPDLDAALAWVASQGHPRTVLFGHSLGGVKVLFYQGQRQRPEVVGVVSCSSPKHFYSVRAAEQPGFVQYLEQAEAAVVAGRGDELFWERLGGPPRLFSARTYVNKYGREERSDVRPHAARLGCPLLATAGSLEPAFAAHARELAAAAGPERGTCQVFEGAEHFYRSFEPALADAVVAWLARAAPAGARPAH